MKYINLIFLSFLTLSSCNKSDRKNKEYKSVQDYAPYKLIITFSNQIKPKTDLILRSYGINIDLPKGYQFTNEVVTISADYALFKTQNDIISLEQARKIFVSLNESFLKGINSNQEILPYLETIPFTHNLLDIGLTFKDQNQIDLGQGISEVYFLRDKIVYERYEIYEYTGKYPARGRHFKVHEETYEEALDIVKRSGELLYF